MVTDRFLPGGRAGRPGDRDMVFVAVEYGAVSNAALVIGYSAVFQVCALIGLGGHASGPIRST